MASITATEARALYTKALVDTFKERVVPTSFLRSFFQKKQANSKNVSIEVSRGTEMIAVDVIRGSEGNRNTFSFSTEKIFTPPYYREFFEATELEVYDRLFGSTAIDASVLADFISSVQEKLSILVNKIERAIEKQCAEIFDNGKITLKNGTAIDFKRKAGSMVDLGAGQYFANAIDPFKKLEAGCQWLRETGKAQGNVFNAIFGQTALADLLGNAKFIERQNLVNMSLDLVMAPQRNAVGGTYHGQITVGAYKVNLWSYPEVYESINGSGAKVVSKYVNDKKVVLLPEATKFIEVYATVPQVFKGAITPVAAEFVFGEYVDDRDTSHIFDVKSAPICVPVAIDHIYTMQAVA